MLIYYIICLLVYLIKRILSLILNIITWLQNHVYHTRGLIDTYVPMMSIQQIQLLSKYLVFLEFKTHPPHHSTPHHIETTNI